MRCNQEQFYIQIFKKIINNQQKPNYLLQLFATLFRISSNLIDIILIRLESVINLQIIQLFPIYFQIMKLSLEQFIKQKSLHRQSAQQLLKKLLKKSNEYQNSCKKANDRIAQINLHQKQLQEQLNNAKIQNKQLQQEEKKLEFLIEKQKLDNLIEQNISLEQQFKKIQNMISVKKIETQSLVQKRLQNERKFCEQKKFLQQKRETLLQKFRNMKHQQKKQKQTQQQKIKSMEIQRKKQRDQLLRLHRNLQREASIQKRKISQLQNIIQSKNKQLQEIDIDDLIYCNNLAEKLNYIAQNNDEERIFLLLI